MIGLPLIGRCWGSLKGMEQDLHCELHGDFNVTFRRFLPCHDSAFMRYSWKTVARLVKRNLRDFEKVSSLMTSCVKGNCVCLPVLVKI